MSETASGYAPRPGTVTQTVLRLAQEGIGPSEIAARLGADQQYVSTLLYKLRQRGTLTARCSVWSDEELAALRAAVEDGLSGGAAAARLSEIFKRRVTRNMVIGKATRLGLELRGNSAVHRAAMEARLAKGTRQRLMKPPECVALLATSERARPRAASPHPGGSSCASADPKTASHFSGARGRRPSPSRGGWATADCRLPTADYAPRRLPLLALREGMCRFPLGDPRGADFAFCGAAARVGQSYCPHCAGLAYDSPAERAAQRREWRAARGLPAEGAGARA